MNDKVLLIFEDTKNLKKLTTSLLENNYAISICEINIKKILQAIDHQKPDVLIFYYKEAHPEITKIVKTIQSSAPIPITIFSDTSDNTLVSDTIINGATAFIDDGIESHRISHIIDAAKARFQKCQTLKQKLHDAESKLSARKHTDRAKGILMESKNLSEDEAYKLLRSMAMNNNMRIEELAKSLVTASTILN